MSQTMANQIRHLQDRLKKVEQERDKALAALTEIRDLLPLQPDEYARRVFAVAAEALESE